MLIWNYNALGLFMNCAIKDVTIEYSVDGVNWITLEGVTELLPGDGNAEIIDLGGVADGIAASSIRITANSNYTDGLFSFFGLSEVRFYYVDVWPKDPVPANGATGIDPVVTLEWTPGEGVVEHKVYLGTDEQAVIDGTATCYTVMDPSLDMVLSLEGEYFWRVVEVNMASEPNDWSGPTWSFSTAVYRVVDDFESYTTSLKNWKGGNSASGNGAAIALETSIANSGSNSMKFMYDNTVTSNGSEGHSTIFVDPSKLACGKDWTKGDPAYLVFWYYGDLDNATTEEMCVSFNDAVYRIVTPISEIRTPWWTQVTIPFNYGQVDFTKVTAFSIGFYRYHWNEGDGMIYVDDIRLYKNPPVPIVPENPGKSNLVAQYKMENNVKDSSGNGINGTALGDPNYVDGPFRTYGMALEFDANDDVVDLGPADPFNFTGSFSISLFANIKTWNAVWGHAIIATRGEDGIGFQVRHGFRGYLAFTTRGIATPGYFGGGGDQFARQALVTDEWTHIVCVFDADNATKSVYYDGDLIVQETATGLLTPSTTNASIGARANGDNTGFDALFNGNLDDVRVYDKALSEAEVRFLMDPTP
jgi:hypothetical protein